MARWTARKLWQKSSKAETVGELLTGSLLASLSCLIPYVGWLVIMPLCLIMGIGAATSAIALPRRRTSSRLVPALTEPQTV